MTGTEIYAAAVAAVDEEDEDVDVDVEGQRWNSHLQGLSWVEGRMSVYAQLERQIPDDHSSIE